MKMELSLVKSVSLQNANESGDRKKVSLLSPSFRQLDENKMVNK